LEQAVTFRAFIAKTAWKVLIQKLFPTEDKIQVVPRSVRVMVDRYIRQQLQMMVDNLMTGGGGGAVRGAVRNHMYHLTVPFRPMKL